jgi:indole-3-acetate monooxygenase
MAINEWQNWRHVVQITQVTKSIRRSPILAPARAVYRGLRPRAQTPAVEVLANHMRSNGSSGAISIPASYDTRRASSNDWLDKARSLEPLVAQYRDDAERERQLPRPIFDAFHEIGFARMMAPKEFGGAQVHLCDAMEVVEEFARQDGSVGWNASISIGDGVWAGYLPDEAARIMYATGSVHMAGNITYYPGCVAVPAPGGYHLTGRWPFASGCNGADWLLAGAPVMEGENPRLGPDGKPQVRVFAFPVEKGKLLDTWYTTGLRGTGSHDFEAKDVFVPEGFTVGAERVWGVQPPEVTVGYARPFSDFGAPLAAAVALGIARDSIESIRALVMKKAEAGDTNWLARLPSVQEKVGQAEEMRRTARMSLFQSVREMADLPRDEPPHLPTRVASTAAAAAAVKVVDMMFEAGGTSSIYATSRLDRCFRDVHTAARHALVNPRSIVESGQRILLAGLLPD